jgi:two-component system LytT family response regulator
MIKVIIIDDEINCINVLKYELNRLNEDLEIVAEYSDPNIALQNISDVDHDILFLDIEMPRMNAFQFLDALPGLRSNIIFTTAYDHYAMKAFRYYALDYLLKPISNEDLKDALTRSMQFNRGVEKDIINEIHTKIKAPNSVFSKIAVPVEYGFQMVTIEEILYCKADSNYASLRLINGSKIVISKTLKYLEQLLKSHGFYRIHQSSLININYIENYSRLDGGVITMNGGDRLAVSRANKKGLETFLAGYGR